MKKIVILDSYVAGKGLSWSGLSEIGELVEYPRTLPEQVLERSKGAFAIFTNKVLITREIMDALPDLRFIGVIATGYNNVDIRAAAEHGITVCNVPAYSTESVAQTVFAHLLNVLEDVERHSQSVSRGEWSRCEDFSYTLADFNELAALTIGIYGLGNIGRQVAKIANAFGMKVVALTSKEQSQLPEHITKVGREQFFAESDVISLNAPLSADNADFINEQTLAMMKPTAILVNTARGGLVDEVALDRALRERKIYAAALDVLRQEPPAADNPLLTNPYCRITPHIAWQSVTARRRLIDVCVKNLEAFVAGKPINVVKP